MTLSAIESGAAGDSSGSLQWVVNDSSSLPMFFLNESLVVHFFQNVRVHKQPDTELKINVFILQKENVIKVNGLCVLFHVSTHA